MYKDDKNIIDITPENITDNTDNLNSADDIDNSEDTGDILDEAYEHIFDAVELLYDNYKEKSGSSADDKFMKIMDTLSELIEEAYDEIEEEEENTGTNDN